MTPNHFNCLSLSSKSAKLRTEGTFLCSRNTHFYTVNLYTVHEFYVEVYFTYDMERIEHIKVLEEKSKLEQYLPQIDLPIDLYKQ